MKVLLVAYHFPPDPAVGGLRAANVAEALRAAGHQVEVITARLPGQASHRETASGIKVRAVRPWPGPRDWWAWAKRLKRRPASTSDSAAVNGGDSPSATSHGSGLKRLVLSLIWVPDDRQGFVVPAFFAGLGRILRGANLIYTTAPPFSDHLVGLALRWTTWRRWISEFRDPWSDNPWKPPAFRTGVSNAMDRWLERRCLHASWKVVGVTDGIYSSLTSKLTTSRKSKVLVVRNGIGSLAPPRAGTANHRPFRIIYLGTFYLGRDPTTFLKALAQLKRQYGLTGKDVQVDLVGNCRTFDSRSIDREVTEMGLDDLVRFQSWVTHAEAQRMIEGADLLLLLARGQPAQVPNKLYEYLGTRIPILGHVDESGESATMLRAIGGHYVISSEDPGVTSAAVATAMGLDAARVPIQPNQATLEEWTTANQMSRLTQLVANQAD